MCYKLIFYVFGFNLFSFLLHATASPNFEGLLREVYVYQINREGFSEKKYALVLIEPRKVLFPTGDFQLTHFILLHMQDDLVPFINKYVKVEGSWEGIASPSFENVGILNVHQISEIEVYNSVHLDEDSLLFFENLIPVMAEGACKLAHWQALASGCKVIQVEEGYLIEISPDGTKEYLQQLP